jgi:hypothetical protein
MREEKKNPIVYFSCSEKKGKLFTGTMTVRAFVHLSVSITVKKLSRQMAMPPLSFAKVIHDSETAGFNSLAHYITEQQRSKPGVSLG